MQGNKAYLKAMMALVGVAAMTGNMSNNRGREYEPEPIKPVKKPIPAGCKEYTFYGITVHSISEDRAKIKCKKILDNNLQNESNKR